jgi:hypothetical protein
MPYVDLITRNSLARALNADPRAKFLKDLTPLAHLLSGRTRLPLYVIRPWFRKDTKLTYVTATTDAIASMIAVRIEAKLQ